jgi:hypothetical protein
MRDSQTKGQPVGSKATEILSAQGMHIFKVAIPVHKQKLGFLQKVTSNSLDCV